MPPLIKKKAKPVKKENSKENAAVISGQLQKKMNRMKARQKMQRGVVFIKHLPHGFFEDQLRNYFEQFGTVTRLRLARSKLTGGTKGYAYIEFEYPEVAEVAAETMDNYLMFNKLVKAAYIPPERQSHTYFKSSVRQVQNKAGKPIYVSGKTAAIIRHVKRFNDSSEETFQKRTARKLKKINELNKKYGHLGIDFARIVVGAKKITEKSENSNKSKPNGNNELSTKGGKRKSKSEEKSTKKSKKAPQLEALLNETLNEDSDDEDYVAEVESDVEKDTDEEKSNKSIGLQDLLGATLNEDSDDDDWEEQNFESDESEEEEDEQMDYSIEDDEQEDVEEEYSEDDNEESEEDDEENRPPKNKSKKSAKKNLVQGKPAKKDHLDKLIKRNKNIGGIQKGKKAQSKKPKIAKAKNAMHTALTKQIAQPLPLVKNKMKSSKNQKK